MSKEIKYKSILLVAVPIILESLAQNILNITDTAFMGRVGEISLGAAAIGSVFYFAFIMIAFGLGIGAQIIMARRFGEKNYKSIGKVFVQTQYMLIAFALFVFLILKFTMPQILEGIVDSPEIRKEASYYLNFRLYGFLPAFLNVSFRAFYVGIAKTRVITYTTLIMTAVNIFLNYALIFGNFGFPALGIKGAAIASVCAEFTALLFFAGYTFIKMPHKNFGLFNFSLPQPKLLKRILKISYPLMLQYFVSLSCWFTFFVLIEKMGSLELAVSNVIRSIYIFMLLPIWGFSATTNTFVSQFLGRGNSEAMRSIIIKVLHLCLPLIIFIVIIMAIFPHQVLGLLTNDINIISAAIPVYFVVLGSAPLIAAATIFFSALTGTGKTNVTLIIEILVLSVYMLFAWFFIIKIKMPLEVAWTVEYIYAILMASGSLLYLKYGNWRKAKV